MSKNLKELKNRVEIVFLYDVRDANPNGDPDTGNMPRIDDSTGENIVTDVRLKRTIRDFWLSQGKEILVKAVEKPDGNRQSMEDRVVEELNITDNERKKPSKLRNRLNTEIPEKFIDVRAFGAAITMTGANTSITGSAQFGLGRSINIPKIATRTITTSLASGSDKGAGSIGEYHTVDYSLIKFHGIVSEITAQKVKFSQDDLKDLLEGLWKGTESLNTRSKFNHMARFLIVVTSKEGASQIGDLDSCITLVGSRDLHKFDDVILDLKKLETRLNDFADQIESIQVKVDPELQMQIDGKSINVKDIWSSVRELA